MNQFSGISLKTRLYLLVLAAFIPVTVLIVYVAEEQKTIEKNAILHKTKLLAQAAADTENLQLESTRNLLFAIAESFQAMDGQPDRLSGLLANLAGHATGYAVFGILDPSGHLIAGSDPSTMEHAYDDREWLAASLKQKSLTMGPYHGERISREPVIYFARPVFDSRRKTVAVVFAALKLNWMNRSVFKQLAELPKGSRLTLIDENQILLGYEVDTARWTVPQHLDPALQRHMINHSSGSFVAVDEKGESRIYALDHLKSALRQGRVSVVLEIPEKVALAASVRIFWRNLALLAISALIAVFSIWWVADFFILRRVGLMVRAARRLAAGDLQARIGRIGARDELSHLAGVFDEMAGSLQTRIEQEIQVTDALKRSREQLRQLTAYQNDVREQERIRIAREIHDQLGQSLTILKMDLSWIKKHRSAADSPMDEKMAAMSRVIEDAMEDLHAVTAELRPVILDDFGLAAAIEWQVEAFRNRSGVGCRFENDGFEPDLPKDHATALFRIFQEILTNTIRHAKADEVVVCLENHEDELMFQVTDNGCGITEDQINSPRAFGLLGIRERLIPFGGRVTFEGWPDRGTCVTIHLPLPQEGVPL